MKNYFVHLWANYACALLREMKITLSVIFIIQFNLLSAQDCAGPDWNIQANKTMLSVSATANTNGNINVSKGTSK